MLYNDLSYVNVGNIIEVYIEQVGITKIGISIDSFELDYFTYQWSKIDQI